MCSINVYETSLGNVIKRASGQCYNVAGTSFTKKDVKMTFQRASTLRLTRVSR